MAIYSDNMELAEKIARATNETYKHIQLVGKYINMFAIDLINRSQIHDQTKLQSPEVEIFGMHTEELAKIEYGTQEYADLLEKVKPAIDHHYANNRHHAEHHKNGINDMNLVDLLEMLCDWKAATERNKNGNIRKSLEINAKRYNISSQLTRILENTIKEYF